MRTLFAHTHPLTPSTLMPPAPLSKMDLENAGEIALLALRVDPDDSDAEGVLEILRNGGAPPLLEIEAVLRHEHRREAVCRFRHPSGRSTAPMALPFPILHLYYPETAARFV